MKIHGKPYRTIWPIGEDRVGVIDQTKLPHAFETLELASMEDAAHAIKAMIVRGAPLIGATAAYGVALAMRVDASDQALDRVHVILAESRPTANKQRKTQKQKNEVLRNKPRDQRAAIAWGE